MRIVLVGQKWLGKAVLDECLLRGHEVLQVVAPEGDSLADYAGERSIPVRSARRLDAEHVPGCDIILAAHAHAYITPGARARSVLGCAGYHPSLLPLHRGRDAVRWTIHMREPVAGGSLYWMDDGVDSGPIIYQDWCLVRPDDTAATLWKRDLGPMGVRMFTELLRECESGSVPAGRGQLSHLATWEPAFDPKPLKSIN